ncbi:MAG TPA: DUF6165 family protein [Rhizomicrobium sp.]|nr:DUF6165 family protein [Rhizomicrobium sp.]
MREKQLQTLLIPISLGELTDKITILEIKRARITDPDRWHNVEHEYGLLVNLWNSVIPDDQELSDLRTALKAINETIWQVENDIRYHESRGDFGPGFVDLARAAYRNNDRRSAIKSEINRRFNSTIVEEKFYTA